VIFKLVFLFSFIASAYSSEEAGIAKKKPLPEVKSNYLTFGFFLTKYRIPHNEASGVTGYIPLTNINNLSITSLEINPSREFFQEALFSFSIFGKLGVLTGINQGLNGIQTMNYKEKLLGKYYGIGGSINTNFIISKLRVQPFFGYQLSKGDSRYKLSYAQVGSTNQDIKVNYASKDNDTSASLGVRFIDPRSELHSFFVLNYKLSASNTRTLDGSIGNKTLSDLTNPGEVTRSPLSVGLGFGFQF
jgi:hypothetical protein